MPGAQDHQHDCGGGHHRHHVHAPVDFNRAFAVTVALNGALVCAQVFYGIVGNSMALLADAGTGILPFADGPMVHAIKSEIVRAEFYKQYSTTDTDPKKRQEARSRAYRRAIHTAQQRNLIAVRELDGIEWLWLAGAQQ